MKEQDLQNSQIIRENLNELLGDMSAVEFCVLLFQISQLFDDIYDDGVSKDECLELIMKTMVYLPSNNFYRTFQSQLQPLITSMFLQWMSANKIETQGIEGELEKSYMLRAFIYQIFHFCAILLNRDIDGELFQKMYGEKFEEYKREFV
jgi:hypothetical protein